MESILETTINMVPYDSIAGEYYDDFHKTCRNFDETTKVALRAIIDKIPNDGLVLDIGAGRGRCEEYLNIPTNRIIQLDNSKLMLEIEPRESSLLRIAHCAESLPFLDRSFICVTSFLCDSFMGLNFLSETYRVLQEGGVFVGTTPSYEWGKTLRNDLGIEFYETRFITKKGDTIILPSTLVKAPQLLKMMTVVGFEKNNIEITKHKLPKHVTTISEDIMKPAKKVGCSAHDIDIIYKIFAKK